MKLQLNKSLTFGGLLVMGYLMWGQVSSSKKMLLEEDAKKMELTPRMLKIKTPFSGKEDPFRLTAYGKALELAAGGKAFSTKETAEQIQQVAPPPPMSLGAIFVDGDYRAAVINQRVFLEGETGPALESGPPITLDRIFKDRVLVRYGDKKLELLLVPPQPQGVEAKEDRKPQIGEPKPAEARPKQGVGSAPRS